MKAVSSRMMTVPKASAPAAATPQSRTRGIRPGDRDRYRRGNREAASIILANPDRYGGIDGFCCIWARLFLERDGASPEPRPQSATPSLSQGAA